MAGTPTFPGDCDYLQLHLSVTKTSCCWKGQHFLNAHDCLHGGIIFEAHEKNEGFFFFSDAVVRLGLVVLSL